MPSFLFFKDLSSFNRQVKNLQTNLKGIYKINGQN